MTRSMSSRGLAVRRPRRGNWLEKSRPPAAFARVSTAMAEGAHMLRRMDTKYVCLWFDVRRIGLRHESVTRNAADVPPREDCCLHSR